MTLRRKWISRGLVLTFVIASPLGAQVAFNGGLLAGYYRPFGNFDAASVYSTSLPRVPSELSGFAWGGVAQVAFGGRMGAEAQLSVANSATPGVITPAGPRGPTSAQLVVATLQGQYDISPQPESFRLWVSAGPGLIRHGGDAYAPYGSPVSAAGAFGASLRLPIASRLQVTAGTTTLLYLFDLKMPPELRGNPGSLQRGRQTDVLWQLGMRWGVR
jgi:hypothetical protein